MPQARCYSFEAPTVWERQEWVRALRALTGLGGVSYASLRTPSAATPVRVRTRRSMIAGWGFNGCSAQKQEQLTGTPQFVVDDRLVERNRSSYFTLATSRGAAVSLRLQADGHAPTLRGRSMSPARSVGYASSDGEGPAEYDEADGYDSGGAGGAAGPSYRADSPAAGTAVAQGPPSVTHAAQSRPAAGGGLPAGPTGDRARRTASGFTLGR